MTNFEQTIAQKRAEAEAKIAQRRAELSMNRELAKIEREVATVETAFKMERIQATTDRLKDLELTCETIVNSMPIFNNKTRENRKFRPSKTYGLGNHIQLISGLLTGIMYSASEHKQLMLAETGLSEDLIEQAVEAFGSPSYYSTNYNEIIPEVPYNAELLSDTLELIGTQLNVELDLSKITEAHLAHKFEIARNRAQIDLQANQNRLDLDDQTVSA